MIVGRVSVVVMVFSGVMVCMTSAGVCSSWVGHSNDRKLKANSESNQKFHKQHDISHPLQKLGKKSQSYYRAEYQNFQSLELGNLKIIHIMKDGTVRDSVEGIVIPNGEFYKVMDGILKKRKKAKK